MMNSHCRCETNCFVCFLSMKEIACFCLLHCAVWWMVTDTALNLLSASSKLNCEVNGPGSFKILVIAYQTMWCHTPEE